MYTSIYNLNLELRSWIISEVSKLNMATEEDFFCLLRSFDYYEKNYESVYNQLLAILYQDYKLVHVYEKTYYKDFHSLNELYLYLLDNPKFYIDLLLCTNEFLNKDIPEKRNMFKNDVSSFNELFFMDAFDFKREYSKNDLLECYFETYTNVEGNSIDREIVAIDETMDLLYGLYETDQENYCNLVKIMVDEAYLFLKSKSYKEKILNNEKLIIKKVEENDYVFFNSSIEYYDSFLVDIIDSFIQYNKAPEIEQMKIKNKVLGRENK